MSKVPTFVGQVRVERLLGEAFRRAFRHVHGAELPAPELGALVRKEIQALQQDLGADFLFRLSEAHLPSPARAAEVPVGADIEAVWMTPAQRREAESALWFAKLHGIESITEVLLWHSVCNRAAAEAPPLRVCIDRFIVAKRAERLAPKTVKIYFQRLERFRREWGDRQPGSLTEQELSGYLAHWPHPTTKLAHWLTLSALFTWLLRNRYILRNTLAEGVRPPRRKQAARLIFTPEEAEEIMRANQESDAAGFWALSLFAGLRESELIRIQRLPDPWQVVDWKKRTIQLQQAPLAYGQNQRVVELLPSALAWLRWMRREWKPFYPKNHWEKFRVTRARVMAGRYATAEEEKEGQCGREFRGLKVYAMARRSFVAYRMALSGVSHARIADEVGLSERLLKSEHHRRVSALEARRYFAIMPR